MNTDNGDGFADDLTYDEQEYLEEIIERIQSGEEKLTRMIIPRFGEMFRIGSTAILKDEHGFDFDSDRYGQTVITVWLKPLITRKHLGWFPDVRVIRQLSRHWWLVSIGNNKQGKGHDE